MLKRGIKRRPEDDYSEAQEEYAANLSNFQIAARRRESLRLKQTVSAAPGLVEKNLKDKIAVEMSLVEGTAKFIMACKNQSQTLEAAKTLLIARLRSDMLKYELNKLRRGRGSPQMKQGKPSYAGVSLSEIRIPLMWRRKDHINDIGDPRRFAVFCVARIGSQIYDSTLMEPMDRHSTDLTLPDVFLFSKVPSYFEMTIEVYSHLLDKELGTGGISSTPQKIARSISRAVGKQMMKNTKDFENVGPKFELVASATLTLDSCSNDIQSHELYVVEPQSDHCLPLFGQFCCRVAAGPYCCEEEVLSGALTLKNVKNKKDQKLWASLMDWNLKLWTDQAAKDSARLPYLEIPINRGTAIQDIGDDTLTIKNSVTWEFCFEDKENLTSWLIHLIQHAADHRRWKQAATEKMEVLEPKHVAREATLRKPYKRTRSKLVLLYNDHGN